MNRPELQWMLQWMYEMYAAGGWFAAVVNHASAAQSAAREETALAKERNPRDPSV